jgi:hypothetical protein
MPVAIIGAGIAAAGSIGAAVIGSGAQKSAAKTAAQTAKDTTAANNQLQRDIYNSNYNVLSPYVNSGYQANHAINELLGLPSNDNRANSMGGAPTSALGQYGGQQNGAYGTPGYGSFITNGGVGANGGVPNTGDQIAPLNTQAPQGGAPTGGAQSAFQNYLNSTGYQFRLRRGVEGAQHQLGGAGPAEFRRGGQGGAQVRAGLRVERVRQLHGVFVGAAECRACQAGGALAGVGTGLRQYACRATTTTPTCQRSQANSALAQGQSTANLWGTAAGAVGQVGGALISSYGAVRPAGIPRNTYGIVGGDGSGIY